MGVAVTTKLATIRAMRITTGTFWKCGHKILESSTSYFLYESAVPAGECLRIRLVSVQASVIFENGSAFENPLPRVGWHNVGAFSTINPFNQRIFRTQIGYL